MKIIRQLIGLLQAAWIWHTQPERIRTVANTLFDNVTEKCWPALRKGNEFVLYVGFSGVGKTRHSLNCNYGNYVSIQVRTIHSVLNRTFHALLDDDKTVTGRGYWARQWLTKWMRTALIEQLCRRHYCIVDDGCNLVRSERAERLALAKKFGYQTTIVHVTCTEHELMKRLKVMDQIKSDLGESRTWVKLYTDVQRHRYQPPSAEEANLFICIDTTQQL